MTEPKPGSPPYYWVDYATELQALVPTSDERFEQYAGMVQGEIQDDILDVASFCAAEQPTFDDIEAAHLTSGAWRDELRNCALAAVYYKLCQES